MLGFAVRTTDGLECCPKLDVTDIDFEASCSVEEVSVGGLNQREEDSACTAAAVQEHCNFGRPDLGLDLASQSSASAANAGQEYCSLGFTDFRPDFVSQECSSCFVVTVQEH